MTRPSTDVRDRKILKLYREGVEPKVIWIRLELSNVWIVYEAIQRERKKGDSNGRNV